jgi:pimeloyl-ACP methyl ester carboxylesterase
MWNVTTFGRGGWREMSAVEITGPPTLESVWQASRGQLSNESGLLGHLEAELVSGSIAEGGVGRQPISVLAQLAEEESREFEWSTKTKVIALDGDALGLYWSDANTASPAVIAWHEPTSIVVTLSAEDREVQIEYVPDDAADDRAARLRYRHATAAHRLETILDWRGYFGPRSAVIDGSNDMRSNGRGFVTRLRGRTGYLVGRVLRRLTFGHPTLERDPLALSRERGAARKHSVVARACPVLSERDQVVSPQAMVFVHGTASCGLQGLKDLFAAPALPPYQVRRFEHDTFSTIIDNAADLVRLIKTSVRVDKLLLVAHSRGGLVARLALDDLIRDGYPAVIALETFGSPHAGTPLARMGGRLLSQLYKIGEWGLNIAVPVLSPLTWAHSFLFDAPDLPPGISIMAEGEPALHLLNRYGHSTSVTCWGSDFDIDGPASGFGIEIEGMLRGAMYDIENDLVVPTSSALAFGTAAPRLACSHVQYFSQPQVQVALRDYFNPVVPALPQGGTPALAGMTTIEPDSRAREILESLRRHKPPRVT